MAFREQSRGPVSAADLLRSAGFRLFRALRTLAEPARRATSATRIERRPRTALATDQANRFFVGHARQSACFSRDAFGYPLVAANSAGHGVNMHNDHCLVVGAV